MTRKQDTPTIGESWATLRESSLALCLQQTPRRSPVPWIDVCNGLRKAPAVPDKILRVILALSVRIVGWPADDPHTVPLSLSIMFVCIFHADHYRRSESDLSGRLNQHHGAAIAYIELRAVIADANPEVKTESIT